MKKLGLIFLKAIVVLFVGIILSGIIWLITSMVFIWLNATKVEAGIMAMLFTMLMDLTIIVMISLSKDKKKNKDLKEKKEG